MATKKPTLQKKKDNYKHVTAKVATFRNDTTRQDTPAKNRVSHDNSAANTMVHKEGSGADLTTNPFNIAADDATDQHLQAPNSNLNSTRTSI